MHDDQRPYESATDLFCIEPRQDDQPEDKATFWAHQAAIYRRERDDLLSMLKAHAEVIEPLRAQRDDAEATLDAFRALANSHAKRADDAEDRIAMLHDVAVLAVDSEHRGDKFNYGLQVGLILNNLAPLAVRPAADDIALRATADALSSFHASDNDVCATCDGQRYVTDDDDRQTRCPECLPEEG